MSRTSRGPWTRALTAVLIALMFATATRALFDIEVGARRVLVVAIATLVVMLVVVLPVHTLPAAALVLVVLIPPGLFPDELPRMVTPASCVIGVWVVRRLLADRGRALRRRPPSARVMTALLVWCVVMTVVSVDQRVSIGWTVGFAVTVAPAVLLVARREADLVRRAWTVLAVPLAVYTVAESYLQKNVVFGSVPGVQDPQHWTQYRASAAFGHPLAAGTFFVVSFALMVGEAVTRTGRGRVAALVGSAACLTAVMSTAARGSVLAAAVVTLGAVLAVAVSRRARIRTLAASWPTVTTGRIALAAVAIGAVGLFVDRTGPVVARSLSSNVAASNSARWEAIRISLEGVRLSFGVGVGPGASQRAVDEVNPTDVPIESSFLQLLLSIGVPGVLMFGTVLVMAAVTAWRRGDVAAVGAVVALAVSIGTYNMIDARLAYHVLIGLVLLLALQSGASGRLASPPKSASEFPQRAEVASERGPHQA